MKRLNKSFMIETKFCMDQILNFNEIRLRTHNTKIYVAVLPAGNSAGLDFRQLTSSACLLSEHSIVIRDGCLFFKTKHDAKDAFCGSCSCAALMAVGNQKEDRESLLSSKRNPNQKQ